MKLTINKEEELTIVSIDESRLDALIAPEFKQKMEQLINDNNDQIILDISALSFMDSSSLGAIVAVLKLTGKQGKMVISGATGTVMELFKLTRMDSVFTLVESVEDARNCFTEIV